MPPPEKPASDPAIDRASAREAQLALALRANLRRRKAGDGAAGSAKAPPKSVDKA